MSRKDISIINIIYEINRKKDIKTFGHEFVKKIKIYVK